MIKIPGLIPIRIHPIFWFIAAVIGFLYSYSVVGTILWIGVILVSVLVHEYGHALTAFAFGQKASIDLVGFGGLTSRSGERLSLGKEFIVVLFGPLAGFLLFGVAYQLQRALGSQISGNIAEVLWIFVFVNLVWTIINLLPVHPLDGGKLLAIVFEAIFGFRGIKMAYFTSIVIGVGVAMLFFVMGAVLAGALFLLLTFESVRAFRASLGMTAADRNTDMQNLLDEGNKALQKGHIAIAKEKLERVVKSTKRGILYTTATEALAQIAWSEGNAEYVYELLHPIRKQIELPFMTLLQQAAFRIKRYQEAAAVGESAYKSYPSYQTALYNAMSYAKMGKENPSIGWLTCAIRDGLPNVKEVLKREEWDTIRHLDDFISLH